MEEIGWREFAKSVQEVAQRRLEFGTWHSSLTFPEVIG